MSLSKSSCLCSVTPDTQYHFCDAMHNEGNDFSRLCNIAIWLSRRCVFDAQKCTHVTAKSQHFHARENRCCTCVHHESLIALQTLSLAQLLRFALRQPCNRKSQSRHSLCIELGDSVVYFRPYFAGKFQDAPDMNFYPTFALLRTPPPPHPHTHTYHVII